MTENYATKFIGEEVNIKMDRPMGSKHPKWNFIYPVNYGEVSGTKAPDGEAVDAYLLGVFEPINEFKGDCIAVIRRINDDDDKLVVVPKGLKYSDEQIKALVEFQERFFSSEIIRNKEDLR